jgi:hypothetical protein
MYNRAVLVEVLIYHQRRADSGCHCGWGSRPEHWGRSWAEHVADIYEDTARAEHP